MTLNMVLTMQGSHYTNREKIKEKGNTFLWFSAYIMVFETSLLSVSVLCFCHSPELYISGNQLEELESWVGGVESGCEFVEKALTHCPAMEVVLVRKQLGERLMDYANMNVPPAPRENSHLK